MLVLSRRENQKVLFPKLGITVEIVGLKGKYVRLGIDAPSEIRIIRSEIAASQEQVSDDCRSSEIDAEIRHQWNNRLNAAALQIQFAQKLLEHGDHDDAFDSLEQSLQCLRDLEEKVSERPSRPSGRNLPKREWRALLVEDDDNERQLMASILGMCGFEVDVVEDGLAAIDYLKSHERPDCVLMDMQMPRLSGPETISTIREELEFTNVPIYGVSGLKRHEANVPLGRGGVSGWFAKPVDADKMLQQIFADFRNADSDQKSALN